MTYVSGLTAPPHPCQVCALPRFGVYTETEILKEVKINYVHEVDISLLENYVDRSAI